MKGKLGHYIRLMIALWIGVQLSGCMSVKYEDTADSRFDRLVGQDLHAAILELGPPDDSKPDGRDGRVFIWEDQIHYSEPGYEYTKDSITEDRDSVGIHEVEYERERRTEYQPPRSYTKVKYVQLYVSSDSTIYHYRHNIKSEAEKKANRRKAWFKGTILGGGSGLLIIMATLLLVSGG